MPVHGFLEHQRREDGERDARRSRAPAARARAATRRAWTCAAGTTAPAGACGGCRDRSAAVRAVRAASAVTRRASATPRELRLGQVRASRARYARRAGRRGGRSRRDVVPSRCSQHLSLAHGAVGRSAGPHALVATLATARAQREPPPTSSSTPDCSIVRCSPSRSDTSGDQPSSSRASVMSGRRCLGSSTGSAS